MMNCHELIDFIADYLDGNLPTSQRAMFNVHLALCPHCREYLNSYKLTIQMSRKALQGETDEKSAPPPPPLPEELIKAVLAARAAADKDSSPPA